MPSACQQLSRATGITRLPEEMLVRICQYLDSSSMFNLLITCKRMYDILGGSNPFWKVICTKEKLLGYSCINAANNYEDEANPNREEKIGWTGKPMRIKPPAEYPPMRKVFARGLQMRRNIWQHLRSFFSPRWSSSAFRRGTLPT